MSATSAGQSTAADAPTTVSAFLTGAFAPVGTEHSLGELAVHGRLPRGLDGLFTHIGPNPVRPPRHRDPGRYEWFAQDGMVSGIRLRDGRAEWFRRRWIRSSRVSRALQEPRTPGRRHFPIDTVNTNVVAHGGLLLALIETGCATVRLDPHLRTVSYDDRGGTLPRGLGAHPKIDPRTGELHALAYSALHTWAEHTVLDATGVVIRRHRIHLGGRPLLHDFALTEGHLVIWDSPVQFDLRDAVRGRLPYRWNDRHHPRIGVAPRRGDGPVRWYDVAPCFVFHTVTAIEQGRHLTVRAVRYRRLFDADGADPLTHGGQLWQWTIDLDTGTVTDTQLDDHLQELPRTNPHTQQHGARYHYAITAGPDRIATHVPDALLKHDVSGQSTEVRRSTGGAVPSEAVFVPVTPPAGDRVPEDRGWILHWSYDPHRDASNLIVLDAQDFTGAPQAVVPLPVKVPFGFHSSWIPDDELTAAPATPDS